MLVALSYSIGSARADTVEPPPAEPLLAALFADWRNHVLTIYVGYPLPGCLRLIGAGLRDAELPDSCNKATYTIAPAYLSQDYQPQGRTAVLRTYDGQDRAFYTLPADPGYHYLPLVAAP